MTSNIFSLKDRKVLVTGASSGIGATVARKVSELGGVCAITGRDKVRLNDTLQRLSGDGHITILEILNQRISKGSGQRNGTSWGYL